MVSDNPVVLAPGCARLATMPKSTGSPAATNTIGIVDVARLAARASGPPCRHGHPDVVLDEVGDPGDGIAAAKVVSIVNCDADAFDVAGLAERFLERSDAGRGRVRRRGHENTQPRPYGEGLGLGGKRRGEGTGQRGQQEAAAVHHSIVCSPRSRT